MCDEARPVLSVEQALDQVLAAVHVLEPEQVDLLEALGRVLAEEVRADRHIPPLANAAMDGYAVRAADLDTKAPLRLQVVGQSPAGQVSVLRVGPGQAIRIMTGAPLPAGADTVVQFEHTRAEGQWVEVLKPPPAGANVRPAGEDVQAGDVVLRPGKRLRPQEIGMLAALGHLHVSVARQPRVAILATGDEVVPPDEAPGPGQIRDANSYTVAAQVVRWGGVPILLGVARDREELVRRGVREALARRADLIVTSGGVSVGDFDLVKRVLAAEGEMRFWSLTMKPGRPLAFGVVSGVPLLGLPGNPVAAMISMELFGRPALLKMQGCADGWRPSVRARLGEPVEHRDRRRHYLRVRLRPGADGVLEATLTGNQGSGILRSLVEADGLLIVPEESARLEAGALVDVMLLD
jgi:molybdopterin molybdotransferase